MRGTGPTPGSRGLRQLLEARDETDESGSLLTSVDRELDSERVYAFTPRG